MNHVYVLRRFNKDQSVKYEKFFKTLESAKGYYTILPSYEWVTMFETESLFLVDEGDDSIPIASITKHELLP